MKKPRYVPTNDLLRALHDPSIDVDLLIQIAWQEYSKLGSPYGATELGLALWLESRTWATAN